MYRRNENIVNDFLGLNTTQNNLEDITITSATETAIKTKLSITSGTIVEAYNEDILSNTSKTARFNTISRDITRRWIELLGNRNSREFGQNIEINDYTTLLNTISNLDTTNSIVVSGTDITTANNIVEIDSNRITKLKEIGFTLSE